MNFNLEKYKIDIVIEVNQGSSVNFVYCPDCGKNNRNNRLMIVEFLGMFSGISVFIMKCPKCGRNFFVKNVLKEYKKTKNGRSR